MPFRPMLRTLSLVAPTAIALLLGLVAPARADIGPDREGPFVSPCEGKQPGEPCEFEGARGICARFLSAWHEPEIAVETVCASPPDAARYEAQVAAALAAAGLKEPIYVRSRLNPSASSRGVWGAPLVAFLCAAGLMALGLARRAERRQLVG